MAKNIKEARESAVKPFDLQQLKADVDTYNNLREDIANEAQRASTLCQMLEKERGYNIQGFKKASRYAKMSREGAVDELRTFMDTLEAIGLWPIPNDLVDLAEKAVDGEVLPPKKGKGNGRRADAH